MRVLFPSLAALLIMLVSGCTWVDADTCRPNTSGGFGGGGTIPIGPVGATGAGDFSSPRSVEPLDDSSGTPNPCMASVSPSPPPPDDVSKPSLHDPAYAEQMFAAIPPHELALAQTKADFLACSLDAKLESLNLDTASLDEATLRGLLKQYGPPAAEQAEDWFQQSIDPTTLSTTPGPKFECKGMYGCEYWSPCKEPGYIPSVPYGCYVSDCGKARCSTCPEFVSELLRNVMIKSWCAYICLENGTSNIVAVGGGWITAIGNAFGGPICMRNP